MKRLCLALVTAACTALSGPAIGQTYTPEFLSNCRDLVKGAAGPGARQCEAMLEGAIGAMSLLSPEFYPLSMPLGYCLLSDITPLQAAQSIVAYADGNPECETLAHFSMCMNLAFQETYPDSC